VQFTGEGYEVNRNPGYGTGNVPYIENLNKEDKKTKTSKKTKTATAKFGGRFKK